jgi:hypothetical protein
MLSMRLPFLSSVAASDPFLMIEGIVHDQPLEISNLTMDLRDTPFIFVTFSHYLTT